MKTAHDLVLAARAGITELTPSQAQAWQAACGALLIDVREPDEYSGPLGHLAGSRSVPLRTLAARAAEFDAWKQRPLVVVCRAGVRSTTAAAILTSLGFEHVFNLKGGMLAWNDEARAVER